MFEVKVTLEGADEPLMEDWSANGRDKDLEKLREWLEREKERREEHEEVEREMVWIFMHRLMIDPCQLSPALVKKEAPRPQSSAKPSKLAILPKHQQTHRVWQRPNTSADHLPSIANTTNRRVPLKTLPLRPTCPVTLAGSPHPPHQSLRARDHVLASTIAAAIATQATYHIVTRRV